jgi:hypothetical protein
MFGPFRPDQNALCSSHEYHVKLFLGRLNLLSNPRKSLPAHPLRFRWRWRAQIGVIRAELVVQAGEVVVGAI